MMRLTAFYYWNQWFHEFYNPGIEDAVPAVLLVEPVLTATSADAAATILAVFDILEALQVFSVMYCNDKRILH